MSQADQQDGSPGFWLPDGRYVPCIVVGPLTQKPPTGVSFGEVYGRPFRTRGRGRPLVWMFRKGQRCRFFNQKGDQVGPEQRNVVPAVAFAHSQGWVLL